MGLLDSIKRDAKKSGQSKGKFIYFREGSKIRVRFLNDMEDGLEVVFHDNFEAGVNVPCQEIFGRSCPYCDDESMRTRSQYIWSVWNYEQKEVQLFMFAVNNCSPVPALVSMFDAYGTLTDRDYVISVSGKQQNKTFSVVPMDKVKFRNEKAKPYSKKAILQMLDKAWPCELADDDDDNDYDDEDEPKKTSKKKPSKKAGKPKSKKTYDEDEEDIDDYDEDIEDDIDDDIDEDEDEDTPDYSDMSAKELYNLCKKRKIDVLPKKSEKYYIRQLEEADKAEEEWGDEDEEEWEDE